MNPQAPPLRVRLWVPLIQRLWARNWNWARPGWSLTAFRVANSVSTSTPLTTPRGFLGVEEVAGLDISDKMIENARRTSEALGLRARWFRCDVLDAPHELDGGFDLVYTGRGAICWIHDLEGWAAVVARLLRPGGVVSLFDDHPLTCLFDNESEALVPSGIDYFHHAECSRGWTPSYLGDLGIPVERQAVKHERLWPIASIVTALLGAGLTLERLGEHAERYYDNFEHLAPEVRLRLPLTFSLLARKLAPSG